MKAGQTLWSRDELILAINLYCKLPFGQMHQGNSEVAKLASVIGRTPNSVAYKLVNFASLDPSLQARGIKGAQNVSKLDREVWAEFYQNWDTLPYESEVLLAETTGSTVEKSLGLDENTLPREGKMREQMVKVRVNQAFFRASVLASYNFTCCVTGLKIPELLVAGHIKPWAVDEANRMNPSNGLALNSLHDRAFENGLITITPGLKIRVSPTLFQRADNPTVRDYFLAFEGKGIIAPSRFLPDPDLLKYHNEERFRH